MNTVMILILIGGSEGLLRPVAHDTLRGAIVGQRLLLSQSWEHVMASSGCP